MALSLVIDSGPPDTVSRSVSFANVDMAGATLEFNRPELKVWSRANDIAAITNKTGRTFRVVTPLGSGRTAEVFKVSDPEGREFAMKVVDRGPLSKAEVSSLRRLGHPNIVRFEGEASSEDYPQAFIFFELLTGGTLCEMSEEGRLLGARWKEEDARRAIMDLVGAVAHMHQNNVVHRDIKPENCLLRDSGEVVLCDFGASVRPKHGDDATRRTVGTPFFQPPEACSGRKFPTKGQDVWALGVTLYLLLFGRVPFGQGARNVTQLTQRLGQDALVMEEEGVDISPECKEFLWQLLRKDLTQRMSVGEMVRHRWVAGAPLTLMSLRTPLMTPPRIMSCMDLSDNKSDHCSVSTQVSYRRDEDHGHLVPSFIEKSPHTPSWSVKHVWSLSPSEPSSCHTSPTACIRVLVIDDDFSAREHMTRRIIAVTDAGTMHQTLEECPDAWTALAELSSTKRYSLIFIKMHMLSQTAEEWACAVRDWEAEAGTAGKTERIKIVGLALRDVGSEQQAAALESGLDEVLPSPPRISDLRRLLGGVGWATKEKGRMHRGEIFNDSEYDENIKNMETRCRSSPTADSSNAHTPRHLGELPDSPMASLSRGRNPRRSVQTDDDSSVRRPTLSACSSFGSFHVLGSAPNQFDSNLGHLMDVLDADLRSTGDKDFLSDPRSSDVPQARLELQRNASTSTLPTDARGAAVTQARLALQRKSSTNTLPTDSCGTEVLPETSEELQVLVIDNDALTRAELENRLKSVSPANVRQTVFACGDSEKAANEIRGGRVFQGAFINESCDYVKFIKEVRELERTAKRAHARLVVLSSGETRQHREQILECGADEVLLCPPLLPMLQRNLRLCGWLTKSCQGEELLQASPPTNGGPDPGNPRRALARRLSLRSRRASTRASNIQGEATAEPASSLTPSPPLSGSGQQQSRRSGRVCREVPRSPGGTPQPRPPPAPTPPSRRPPGCASLVVEVLPRPIVWTAEKCIDSSEDFV
eukprot:Hpha_TRINITY_DN16856_c0_g5::TRINITY_DN16856_c0_g5_i3::g.152381::m.152381